VLVVSTGKIQGLAPVPVKETTSSIIPQRRMEESTAQGKQSIREPAGETGILKAIEEANRVTVDPHTSFRFSIHEATHRIMVKIINEDNGEVIREIPPEKILDLVAGLWELAGILVDERV